MKQIKWSDFKIIPLTNTVYKEEISDEVYFSKKYSNYISNSRLALINPSQGGSPKAYFEQNYQGGSTAFQLGTAVHQLFLQPEEFNLVEGLNKPSAKLGQVIDKIKEYRNNNYSILESIQKSSEDVGYYIDSLTENRIINVIKKGFYYYWKSKELNSQCIVLNNTHTKVVKNCLETLQSHRQITKIINAVDFAGDPIDSFNEDALFMDIKIIYQNTPIILKFKMKADNWTIDQTNRTVCLNDLKTTGKPLPFFMQDYGGFVNFHYARQMAAYSWLLKNYCVKHFEFNADWECDSNMIVVETIPPFRADCYRVSKTQIRYGMLELFQLLKRVAYYEIHGFDEEVGFI